MRRKYNFTCPCCGIYEFDVLGEYNILSHCGWEDGSVQ
ncbi:CPCC family cysteine-rich protein [Pectobacterium cacticida]